MLKLNIHTKIPNRFDAGNFMRFPAEIEADSFEAVNKRLTEEGSILCTRVFTSRIDGQNVATKREPIIIASEAIMMITPVQYDYIEAGE